jgi:diguanylate cyclase (GGDEF)-like protein/PAS domain S-box-containing protein
MHDEMRFSSRVWWLYLAAMLAVALAYLLGPLDRGPVFNAIGFSACIAIVAGVRKHRPAAPWGWYLIAVGQALFVLGDVLAYNYRALFGAALPFPSVADPLYLAVYPVTVAGLLVMIRRRNPGRDWASLIDASIVTIGLGLLSWVFLIAPYTHDSMLHLGPKLVSIAYPLGDILLLGVAVRMAVGGGRRNAAFYLMISAIVAVLATDSVYGWIVLHGTYRPGDPLDGGWILYYVLLGAAALHPSMTTVAKAAEREPTLTSVRVLGIAAAALIAPVIIVVNASSGGDADAIVVGSAAIVLFALVVIRMIGLARGQEAAAARERTLRRASDAFVTATNRQEIVLAAEQAAALLAGAAAQPTVLRIERRGAGRWLVGGDPRSTAELRLAVASLPERVRVCFQSRVAVDLRRTEIEALCTAPIATPVFAVPILSEGHLAGAVVLLNAAAAPASTRSSLETLASQVGLALESADLTKRLLRTESDVRLSTLVKHSTDLILVLSVDTTVEYVSPSIRAMLGYEAADFRDRRLSDYIAEVDRGRFQPAYAALVCSAAETSQAFEFGVRHRDGRTLRAECLATNLLEDAAVGGVVVNMRDITERKEFEAQLTYQAFHDPVTDLANRALFRDRVEHAFTRRRDRDRLMAVLFMDLDDFKTINDTFGHDAGDRLLQAVSARLKAQLRAGDTVARLGGDEFAILLEDIRDEAAASDVVEGVLEAIRAPLTLDGREVSIQCSIGIAVADPSGERDVAAAVEELLRNADVAMYQAKAGNGDTYRQFRLEMHDAVVEQIALRTDLKAAVAADQLTLAYQPVFDLRTGEIAGYEALLRWQHAVRGAVAPATFIPIAEDSGLIVPLGCWVLERACRDAVAFQLAAHSPREQTVSVNISARQLQRAEIVGEVAEALRSSGLAPRRLVLEITESLLIEDVELAIERLSALRELGVRIAIDDFGTGYSSLTYIRRLPIDLLKIDKSFIDSVDADDTDGKLTSTIISLARVLELGCVAEGVERPAQAARLKELDCDFAQGFLFARPMPAAQLRDLLAAVPPATSPPVGRAAQPHLAVPKRRRRAATPRPGHGSSETPGSDEAVTAASKGG